MNDKPFRSKAIGSLCGALSLSLVSIGTSSAAEPLNWVGCGISKKAYVTDLAKAFQARYDTKINIKGGGATKGIRDVSALGADIGGSCRPLLYRAKEERHSKLAPVGWDALVAIVHPDNPIDDISIEKLRSVVLGEVNNWRQLGGPESELNFYARNGKISGVGHTIRTLLLGDAEANFGNATLFKSSGPLEKAIENNTNAIGITGISSARKRNVKILSVNGKLPTYDNVASGQYLMYRPLYLAYNPDNPRVKEIKEFIKFAYSDEGQEIMRANGTIPYLEATNLFATSLNERLSANR